MIIQILMTLRRMQLSVCVCVIVCVRVIEKDTDLKARGPSMKY